MGAFGKKSQLITVDKQFNAIPQKESADLLSICVLPDRRGSGLASRLVDEYEAVLIKHKRRRVVLGVRTDNVRAIRFYEKKGFSLYKEAGTTSRLYAKFLDS